MADDLGWMAGGGESGALMRSIDWGKTPVGPIATWPASLRTTVGILLHSRHPMFLWWGPELIQFYNDAYLPSFGRGKHPTAMGQRGRECWPEIWPLIFPQIDDVMARAVPSWNEDQLVPIYRNERLEEVYWSYGYSPVMTEDGHVGGTLVVCTETTSRIVSARRLQLLRDLIEQTVLSGVVDAARTSMSHVLSRAGADVPFFAKVSGEAGAWAFERGAHVGLSDAAAPGLEAALADRVEALAAACARDGAQPLGGAGLVAGPWPEPVTQLYVVPLARAGQRRGFAIFGVSPRLPFDGDYRAFLDQVAAHAGLVDARVESAKMRTDIEGERDHLLMQAPVAISIVTGRELLYQLANPHYRQMVGRDVVGKTYREAFPEIAATELPSLLEDVYRSGRPFVSDEQRVELDRGDGVREERFFRFNLEPLRDAAGRVYGLMSCAMDVTPQVRSRRVLEKTNAEREGLLQELESANRAKDEFLAMLGHELRNPLSPIVTALELMKQHPGGDNFKARNVIERQVTHLVRLVDDLLDVSKITRGKIDLKKEVVQIGDVVRSAVEIASVLLEQRGHALSLVVPRSGLLWRGDRVRLAQAVANLLTNAARYTPPGGRLGLEVRRDGGDVLIAVTDNGIGISPEMLPRIFELFVQGQRDADRAAGGLGIGLTLTRTLVSMHGGTVTASSDGPGRGSTFVIRLPAPPLEAVPPAAAAPHAAPFAGAVHRKRVLVVDDNVDAAEALGEILRESGHEVSVVHDPLAALDVLERTRPNVAVVDIGMPVMDGYELAARMRQTESGRSCRLIALTGYGQERDRLRSRDVGFSDHFVKPVDLEALLDAIDQPPAQPPTP